MTEQKKILIVGAGIAGVQAARTFSKEGYDGKVILIDSNKSLPYDRPPLSKDYLTGKMKVEDLVLESEQFYKDRNIELKLGHSVTEINPDNKSATLENGEIIFWDRLLITIGSKVRHLQYLDDLSFNNVFYMKTQQGSERLKAKLNDINHLLIIGAGFIGLEVAASLRSKGKKVTVIEAGKAPLARVLGKEVGEHIAGIHRNNGVNIITDDYVTEFVGENSLSSVITKKEKTIYCDGILVGVGVYADSSLVEQHVNHQDGILVNEFCQTSHKDIYAAGDCAKWPYFIEEEAIRVEHWDHSINQGKTAALNIIYQNSIPYETIPYFWSDQYDTTLQYIGHPLSWDSSVLRGNFADGQFTILYMKENHVVGALLVNDFKNLIPIKKLIREQTSVNEEDLLNQKEELRKLVKRLGKVNKS